MTKDEIINWFKSAPKGSRHQRMLWAADKIARLTGVTEGGAYQMLLSALIEAEERSPIPGFSMTADEKPGRARSHADDNKATARTI